MEMSKEKFAEEITNNFSELFVETFFMRYISEFDKSGLLDDVKEVIDSLQEKVKKEMIRKLQSIGFNKKDIKL